MEPSEFLKWVDARKRALKIKGDSPVEKRAGHPDCIRNVRRGLSFPKLPALRALADILGDPPPGLLDASAGTTGLPSIEEMESEMQSHLQQGESHMQEAERLRITIEVLKSRQKAS